MQEHVFFWLSHLTEHFEFSSYSRIAPPTSPPTEVPELEADLATGAEDEGGGEDMWPGDGALWMCTAWTRLQVPQKMGKTYVYYIFHGFSW